MSHIEVSRQTAAARARGTEVVAALDTCRRGNRRLEVQICHLFPAVQATFSLLRLLP
jgi:hypothetical protein